MENKINEILSNRADYYIDSNGKSHDIIRGHPNDIMDEIVKLFAIPDVINQACGDCLYYLTCNSESRDKQICDNYDNEL